MAADAPQQRRTAYYKGRVQGVGFRYTVRSIAEQFAVTGFVQNLDDGRVQLVVEGIPAELDRFLEQVSAKMNRYIRHIDVVTSVPAGQFSGFSIEHHS